jgi:ABC-type multidrug transport system fused ATPase/permease subunit
MLRMAVPDRGEVLLDGHGLSTLDLTDLRRQVAVAWQDAELFRGTVRENLTLGTENVSEKDVYNILRICRLDTLIAELPLGLDTVLGERGVNLSGGQRQRLAVARAVLRRTPIIFFDEAMSQVDARMEEEIVKDLLSYLRGRTVVLVTHRMATASYASEILVLDSGRIVASGDHAALQPHLAFRRLLDASLGDNPSTVVGLSS